MIGPLGVKNNFGTPLYNFAVSTYGVPKLIYFSDAQNINSHLLTSLRMANEENSLIGTRLNKRVTRVFYL